MENKPKVQISDLYFIRDFVNLCIAHWAWFLISLAACLSIGAFSIMKSQNIYKRTAVILIKESFARRSSNELETVLNSGGVSQMNTKLVNEMVAFKSPDLVKEVVTRLNMEVNYFSEGRLKNTVLYGSSCPIIVTFLPGQTQNVKFRIEKTADGMRIFNINDSIRENGGLEYKCHAGDTVYAAFGVVRIDNNPAFTAEWKKPIMVSHSDIAGVTATYAGRVSTEAHDTRNFSDLMELSINDESPERAVDFLNTLIAVYNENWVNDRNQASRGTAFFIDERLDNIKRELNMVDDDISSFKSRNLLPDISAVSSMYMKKSDDIESQAREIDNQLHVIRYTKSFLINTTTKGQLIPAPAGISNATISSQVAEYNTTQLQRNKLVESSSEINPLVKSLDANLKAMKETILMSLDNEIEVLQSQLDRLARSEKQATARLADNPNQAKYLLNIERQQKVKESLYLYLLQKREENELSQAFAAYNTKLVSKPSGSNSPVSPQRSRIMLIAFLLGCAIPVALLYIREIMNTKVRGRKDLDNLSIPLLGEIPQSQIKNSRVGVLSKGSSVPHILVKPGMRDSINESFRVLRTNLEFVAKSDDSKVFAVTSFNAGSGKSFISSNLGSAIAITGKKVLLIDGDLRHASTSKTVKNIATVGLADYLSGNYDYAEKLIVASPNIEGLDILPVGTIPPNPTELIGNAKFGQLIDKYRKEYDYVLIDCPPVEIVADTQIIENYVDRTLFIIRAGLFERVMLPTMESMKDRPEYKNISIVLNGTETQGSYHGYSYGYRYGYSYGYRYGYHSEDYYYSSNTKKNKSFMKRNA